MNNKQIEDRAIKWVKRHLRSLGEEPESNKQGADVISNGKYIDVKGCMGKATYIRMVQSALDNIAKEGMLKQGNFYIYYVYDMASGKPKLMIFDWEMFNQFKIPEIKWVLRPFKIQEETGKPEVIYLK